MKRIQALISYIVRESDGIDSVTLFIESLDKYGVSPNNTVHIGIKDASEAFRVAVGNEVAKKKHSFDVNITLLPNIGYDLGSHFTVAQRSKARFLIFMTATSRACKRDWDVILLNGFSRDCIGIVGSMKSSESIKTSFIDYLDLRINLFFRFRPTNMDLLVAQARNIKIKTQRIMLFPDWVASNSRPLIRKLVLLYLRNREPYSYVRNFPEFPNPHIRTTGLAIKRELFLNIFDHIPMHKFQAYGYESGFLSLSKRISLLGWETVIVDYQGCYYDISDLRGDSTFRSIKGKSLVSDRESRRFDLLTLSEQSALQFLTHQKLHRSNLQFE